MSRHRSLTQARLLVFPVEHTTPGGIPNAQASRPEGRVRSSRAIVERGPTTLDFIAESRSLGDNCMDAGAYEQSPNHLQMARQHLEADPSVREEERAKLLGNLKVAEDRVFAFGIGAKMAHGRPAPEQRQLAQTLCRANPDLLAAFRRRVEAGAALGKIDRDLALISG